MHFRVNQVLLCDLVQTVLRKREIKIVKIKKIDLYCLFVLPVQDKDPEAETFVS